MVDSPCPLDEEEGEGQEHELREVGMEAVAEAIQAVNRLGRGYGSGVGGHGGEDFLEEVGENVSRPFGLPPRTKSPCLPCI